jgi:hypothetical protein
MTQEQQQPTREGLKVSALLERIAQLENEKADLRVDFTVTSIKNDELQKEVAALKEELGEKPTSPDTADGSN